MYTKGEWEVYLSTSGETRYITTRDKPNRPDKVIARLMSGLKEEEANANLIAAAPKLCVALEIMIKHFRTLDKLYSKDLEVLNITSRALADVEGG